MRRLRWLIPQLIFLLIFAGTAEATDGLRGDECVVATDEVITQDFYFFCNTLVIEGYIDGDIAGIASEVTIAREGHVTGDIWVLGGQLTIEGMVGDDVHFIGIDLDITGLARFPSPRTDIVGMGVSMEVAQQVVIPGDVIYYGYQAILNGKVNGNVDFQGQALIIQNTVGGDVAAIVGDQEGNEPLSSFPLLYSVNFREPGLYFTTRNSDHIGYINGNLSYEAPQRVSTLDNVGGRVRYTQAVQQAAITQAEQSETFLKIVGNYILVTARDVAALGFVGIMTLNFFSVLLLEPGYRVQTQPISAFSWGLMFTLTAIPTALLLLIGSLVVVVVIFVIAIGAIELTIMAVIMTAVVNLGFLGGFFFFWAFLGRAITCFVIGFFVLRWVQHLWIRYRGAPHPVLGELWLSVIVGVILVALVVNLPLGSFVDILQLFLTGIIASAGFGALFMYLRDVWYLERKRVLVGGEDLYHVPSPPDDLDMDVDVPVGMDNLPQGFKGFDD